LIERKGFICTKFESINRYFIAFLHSLRFILSCRNRYLTIWCICVNVRTYVGVSYKYPLAADLTGNRASFPDSAATVLEQRMRMADGYSHEGAV